MAYICEQELINIFEEIAPKFKIQGIDAEVALKRDYLLKIRINENGEDLGKLIIDYSPKRGAHSYRKDSDLSEQQFARLLGFLGTPVPVKGKPVKSNNTKVKEPFNPTIAEGIKYHAYVDGSFIDGRVGYGAVILNDGIVVAELFGTMDSIEAFSARQVGGEIKATMETLKWCQENNVAEIAIFYDFQNIEKWATGQYRTNTPMTQEYKQFIDSCGIKITWIKVSSHTGVELNDRADELAKKGARQS